VEERRLYVAGEEDTHPEGASDIRLEEAGSLVAVVGNLPVGVGNRLEVAGSPAVAARIHPAEAGEAHTHPVVPAAGCSRCRWAE